MIYANPTWNHPARITDSAGTGARFLRRRKDPGAERLQELRFGLRNNLFQLLLLLFKIRVRINELVARCGEMFRFLLRLAASSGSKQAIKHQVGNRTRNRQHRSHSVIHDTVLRILKKIE